MEKNEVDTKREGRWRNIEEPKKLEKKKMDKER